MPHYLVEGQKIPCKWVEYYASILPPGTPIWYRSCGGFFGKPKEGTGIYKSSWNYDGIIAEIEVMGCRGTISLHLALGDRMKRLKNTQMLAAQGCGGDGI